ncbi:MAG: hypothetical protein JHD02_07095 [Thermoleophilaceae bacterium]|nr:hypothetical protein [Thermoleophilaceae bacterium]
MSVLLVTVAALLVSSAVPAQAGTTYDFNVGLDDGVYSSTPGGNVAISGLSFADTRRIVVTAPSGSVRLDTGVLAAGASNYFSSHLTGFAPGDTVSVRQPGSSVAPTESFTIPNTGLSVVTGATAITGTVPAGWSGNVRGDYRCGLPTVTQTFGAGAFSMPYSRILPGETASLTNFNTSGDYIELVRHSPGETPCVRVDAISDAPYSPGGAADPTPYEVGVDHLLTSVSQSVRIVLRRGATILADASQDTTYGSTEFATKPLPGDIVDIYRPKTAPSPSSSMTLPPVSGVFDAAVDKVAINTPAAGLITAYFCRTYVCATQNARSALNVPAGVKLLDFAAPQSRYAAMDVRPDDVVTGLFEDPDHTIDYYFEITPGDLVAPTQSFRLAGKLKRKSLIKAFKKGFKVSLSSTEVGSAKLSLTLPLASTKSKKKPRTITLANATRPVVIGTTTVYLKFTKSGRKALKGLPKKTSRSATLTSTVTDTSGNASTIVKKTKIKA